MKRSPVSPLCSPSSPSSSSCSSDIIPPKPKRARKIPNPEKCQNAANCRKRSSMYRGVTRHRWTGRFEAHLWDKSSWNNIQNKKGRQVYLGAYDSEEAAARTYDLAALKYWGPETILNFPIGSYTKEVEEMDKVSKEEYLATLRRQSSGFSRGVSKYRGVARHHHNGRWEARIGRVFGNKYLYLGTYNTQEEAAAAYDMAALEYRGANAITNFDISHYIERLREKGIVIDFDQARGKQPCRSVVVARPKVDPAETEIEVEQPLAPPPPPQQQQQQQEHIEQVVLASQDRVQNTGEGPPCTDEDGLLINIFNPIDEHDFRWNFNTDGAEYNQYSVPDVTLGRTEGFTDLDLIDGLDFEDDIDFMFSDLIVDNIDDITPPGEGVGESESSTNITEEALQDNGKIEGNADSPSSTTTSVSCDY